MNQPQQCIEKPDAPAISAALVADLIYLNYAHNRRISPEVAPERWAKVYGAEAVARFETWFQDELAKRQRDDQVLLANSLCRCFTHICHGRRALVTWAPDEQSYVVESGDEATARWAGYQAHREEQDEKKVAIWVGTRPTQRNTFAAQFVIVDGGLGMNTQTRTERPLIAVFMIIAAIGAVGNFDYADALEREAEAKLALVFRTLQNDPIKPPRCPRFNAESIPLKYSVAAKADRLEWVHLCHYEPWTHTKGTQP